MKKILSINLLAAALWMNAQTGESATQGNSFGTSPFQNSNATTNTDAQASKDVTPGDNAANPGDPLPINDYAYLLLAAGAGLAVYVARKRHLAN